MHDIHVIDAHSDASGSDGSGVVQDVPLLANFVQGGNGDASDHCGAHGEVLGADQSQDPADCSQRDSQGVSDRGSLNEEVQDEIGPLRLEQGTGMRPSRCPSCRRAPCMGRHSIAPFARQSLSGSNGHAVWIACSRCALRLLYVPTHGAPAMYRSAGPLLEDTRAKLTQVPNATAEELTTKAIALDGAEASALQNLKKIKGQKASLQKEETMGYKDQSKPEPKAKISPTDVPAVDLTSEGPMPVETGSKKVTMREHTLPAEQQEQETAQGFEVIAS